ncbi:MAG: hypothetical protein RL757_1897 [Bacteroidota bacterium]
MKNLFFRLLPIVLLFFQVIVTAIQFEYEEMVMMPKSILGIVSFFIIVIIYFFTMNPKVCFYLTGFIACIASVNLIAFTNSISTYEVGFSINSFSVEISIQLFPLVVFLIWLMIFFYFDKIYLKKILLFLFSK